VLPLNPARFALMAKPAVDQLQELRAEVDQYIGVNAVLAQEVSSRVGPLSNGP